MEAAEQVLSGSPLQEWFEKLITEEKARLKRKTGRETGWLTNVAAQFGVGPRALAHWREDYRVVIPVSAADRICCAYGDPGLLSRLWPEVDLLLQTAA